MVERQGLQMTLPLMLMYVPLFISFGIPYPYSEISFVTGFVLMIGWSVISIWLFPLLARKYHWIWVQPTSDETPGSGWLWKGRFQIRWTTYPTSEFISGGRMSDGSQMTREDGSKGYYQTKVVPEKPAVKHPRYNHRRKLRAFYFRHLYPIDRLMPYSAGVVVYEGFPADKCPVTWCVANELMPEVHDLMVGGKRTPVSNHIPIKDDDGFDAPVFEVFTAKGTRAIIEERRKMRLMKPMLVSR